MRNTGRSAEHKMYDRISTKSLQTTNAGKDVEKREPLNGNVNWYSNYGKQYGVSSKN